MIKQAYTYMYIYNYALNYVYINICLFMYLVSPVSASVRARDACCAVSASVRARDACRDTRLTSCGMPMRACSSRMCCHSSPNARCVESLCSLSLTNQFAAR